MSENTLQFKWIVTIEGGLDAIFVNDSNVFVAGDLLWYPVEGNPNIRSAPDAMVVFGRPKGNRGSYKQWEEGNIHLRRSSRSSHPATAPERWNASFSSTNDMEWRSTIFTTLIAVILLVGGANDILEEVPVMAGFQSPRLKIRFEPGEGPDDLKIIGPDGEPFLTYAELVKQRSADRQRAQEKARLAEEKAQLAEQQTRLAEQQAEASDRLAAQSRTGD